MIRSPLLFLFVFSFLLFPSPSISKNAAREEQIVQEDENDKNEMGKRTEKKAPKVDLPQLSTA